MSRDFEETNFLTQRWYFLSVI